MQPVAISPTPFETEAAFVLPGEKRLAHLGEGLTPRELSDWFAHQVARQPENLRAHVQRINHHLELGETAATSGALADLFLILGDKGQPLRRMMLERCRTVLPAAVHAWFATRMDDGLRPNNPLPDACPSILWSGALGATELVLRQQAVAAVVPPSAAGGDPILDAVSEMIMEGDFSAAVDALVSAIVRTPSDTGLTHELKKLLLHLGDETLWSECRTRLARYGITLNPTTPST